MASVVYPEVRPCVGILKQNNRIKPVGYVECYVLSRDAQRGMIYM
ncbi:hypothetical protein Nwat_2702 [Nitrosococcus watsonii C-113]|uniref:Uncharacterized protein n=1 Tax=Nitrosococcus watsoni (strain C-113) TaxID=105559 RepID=D8KAP3_NITWC|nr:hypothetical protein Nwat_2702 [Nitrosococcus watsonii C-113]